MEWSGEGDMGCGVVGRWVPVTDHVGESLAV